MALVKTTLEENLKALFKNRNLDEDKFATELAGIIDAYIKTATVATDVTTTVATPSGAGTGAGKGTGSLS